MHQLGVILYTGSLLESVGKEEDVWEDVGDRNQPLQLQLLNRLHLCLSSLNRLESSAILPSLPRKPPIGKH
jgi:hypothetical protein